jgi:beta-glucosidase/6-phospho-beta-glucosidase/beta-galactosidase
MAERLGDRVKHYFTINEFRSFVEAGYRSSTSRSEARPCSSAAPPGYRSLMQS